MSLKEYARKRNFRRTAEPRPKPAPDRGQRFVVQKHAASRLHFDFRLELAGTLKSWAVPKGIPFAKGEKRLAVQVEDHPVSYIDFEGTIPQGQYGGGTVMVWDHGTFATTSPAPARDLAAGKLHFTLSGRKLHGEWHLVRLRDDKQWLLIRGGDDLPALSKKLEDTSARSGKTMQQIAAGRAVWHASPPAPTAPTRKALKRGSTKTTAHPLPKFVEPMKARLVSAPPAGEWRYEIKFDGYRALACKAGREVRLISRNEKDFSSKFPELIDALADLPVENAVVDGEIVALDSKGRSSFQLLQAFAMGEERPPLFYYAFDLLQHGGKSLQNESLDTRKATLEKILRGRKGLVRYSAPLGDNGRALLKKARQLGIEGLIGKRPDSRYESGRRSGAWIKLKLTHEQEFVIGGYTNPEGSRACFGALLVGYYQGKSLVFAGKVGTGFNERSLRQLHARFQKLIRATCPFSNLPEARTGGHAQPMTATAMKRCHWLQPSLVCQLKFSEWTRDGKLRQPVFLGLREDKSAREVVREKPA
jgi:bifunctional non-homologous end joining protein LigD